MSEEILINVTSQEVRAAVIEGGVVQQVFIERRARRGLTGNIYQGRVVRVLPGMQAAFVELGLPRTGFLPASKVRLPLGVDPLPPGQTPDIKDLLREGDSILVQVVKDQLGTKGVRLSTFVSVPSRYLVMLPNEAFTVGISGRISTEKERTRLRDLVTTLGSAQAPCGYIVRTAAEGVAEAALGPDMDFLHRLWEVVSRQAQVAPVPSLVHEDLPLPIRLLRDLVSGHTERVRIDDQQTFAEVREFAASVIPELVSRLEFYASSRPLFALYEVEEEIQKALNPRVALQSGGHLIIDQMEALTSIDVNTGSYVGQQNLEETILRTNLEAAVASARQLRLRNLGGIIIIDFIDMVAESNREQVLETFAAALKSDHTKVHIADVSPLGLVQMTRKKTQESLEHQLCKPCPVCAGKGHVKSPETICYEIFREIKRQNAQFSFKELVVLAHPDVIDMLGDEESGSVAELAEQTGKPIRLQADGLLTPDQFDLVLV